MRLRTLLLLQTLAGHSTPITALDFSEPYGTLVSASQEESQPRVWDLLTGEEIGRLRGHQGTVKCIQVEDHVCLTGGDDGTVRLWDLRRVDDDDEWEGEMLSLSDVAEEDESHDGDGAKTNGIRPSSSRPSSVVEQDGPSIRVLEGHSKAVSALYFEDECLVSCWSSEYDSSSYVHSVGDRSVRQDNAAMGSHNWAVCHDHGHPVGYFASSRRRTGQCIAKSPLPWCSRSRGRVCRPYSSICGWELGYVPRFRWRCAVLGLCACKR